MIERISDYDWECAFQCCGIEAPTREYNSRYNEPKVSAVLGSMCKADPFTREDVKTILAIEDGENDGAKWIGVFELSDGRFAFLSAGCDYTGWDCQSGGHAMVADNLADLVRLGLGDEDRVRLGDQLGKHL